MIMRTCIKSAVTVLFVSLAASCSHQEQSFTDRDIYEVFGPVKELNTVRKVYMEDGNEVDNTWYDDAQWSTRFDENGFVTYFAEYDVTYDEAYKSCVYHMEGENQNGKFYSTYEFSLDTIQNGIKLNGEWNGTNGGGLYQIECCFDAQRRPTIMHRSVDDVFFTSMQTCYQRTYFYQGEEKLPFKMECALNSGGWEMKPTMLIKYDGVDQYGNWLNRKIYDEEIMKLYFEETRTISYY